MIEAYEIGIALVLRDGVSSGLAAIQKDLAGVDRAIAATAIGLADLQRVAMGALAAAGERTARASPALPRAATEEQAIPAADVPEAKATPAPSAAGHAAEMPARPVATAAATAASPVMPPVSGLPSTLTPMASAQATPAAADRPEAGAPIWLDGMPPGSRSSSETPAHAPASPAAAAPARTEVVSPVREALPASPVIQIQRNNQAGMPMAAAPQTQATSAFLQPLGQPEPRAAVTRTSSPDSGVVKPAWPNRNGVGAGGSQGRQRSETRAASPTGIMNAAFQTPSVPASPLAMAPSYAPPPVGQQDGRMSGDVFLDGARVGRWLSARLEREAGRPTSGPTGFDPRRSPSWPGATVLP